MQLRIRQYYCLAVVDCKCKLFTAASQVTRVPSLHPESIPWTALVTSTTTKVGIGRFCPRSDDTKGVWRSKYFSLVCSNLVFKLSANHSFHSIPNVNSTWVRLCYTRPSIDALGTLLMFKLFHRRKAEVPTGDESPVPREESTAARISHSVPLSNRNTHRVLRKQVLPNSHQLPSSERNYRSVPASNRKAYQVLSSECNYHAVPGSNRNTHRVLRKQLLPNSHSLPSPERNYHSVPTSDSKAHQVLRKNYHGTQSCNVSFFFVRVMLA